MAVTKRGEQIIVDKTGEVIDSSEIVNAHDKLLKDLEAKNRKDLAEMGFKSNLKLVHRKIRNKDHRNCHICGTSEVFLGERLCVHHIDFNKMQGCDGYDTGCSDYTWHN